MTYLTCVQEVAELVGVVPPVSINDPTPVARRFKRFADRAGQEIARRCDWRRMLRSVTLTGDGEKAAWPLPANFNRLAQGNPVLAEGGDYLRGALAQDEWNMLSMLPQSVGGPSRFFTLMGGNLMFRPVPPDGAKLVVNYVTGHFVVGSSTEHFTMNEDATYFPERLIVLNMVWRWRRAQGAPYDDEMKEYEAELAAEASADTGERPPAAAAA